MQGAQVWSLVGELRFYMSCIVWPKTNKRRLIAKLKFIFLKKKQPSNTLKHNPDSFMGDFCQIIQETDIPFLFRLFQKMEKKETSCNQLYEVSIILICKLVNDNMRK